MDRCTLFCNGVGMGLALLAPLHASAASDVLSLPLASVRVGNDLASVWTESQASAQVGIPWGDVVVNLPGCVVVTGYQWPPPSGIPQNAVWIWRPSASDDPLARYGMRHAQTLVPAPPPEGVGPITGFGRSVAGDEHWLFVGAPYTTVDGIGGVGVVQVFRREQIDLPWTPFATLVNALPDLGGEFGASVAFDGATLVVGVPWRRVDPLLPTVGGADLFEVTATSIKAPRSFTAPLVTGYSSRLGARVAAHGVRCALSDPDAAVIGASGVVMIVSTDEGLAVEAILTTPSGQAGTLFGDSISLDDGRLAVGAPKEDVAGKADAGVARIYQESDGAWPVAHTLIGATANAQLGQVALDGDLFTVGAWLTPVDFGGWTLPGECSLYHVAPSGLSLLARAQPWPYADPVHLQSGRVVALGHGRWSFAERIGSGPFNSPSVRSFLVGSAFTDCDGDGLSDLQDVLSGVPDHDSNGIPDTCVAPPAVDCDGDGIADSAGTLFVPSIEAFSAGSGYWGFSTPSAASERASMWIVPLEVPAGTDGVLRGIEADWASGSGSIAQPQPVFVAVYDDPNQDGDPSDVVLRGAYRASVPIAGGADRVFFDPIDLGPPGTKYFAGLGVLALKNIPQSLSLRGASNSPPQPPRAWLTYATGRLAADFNVEHPAQNATFQLFTSAPTMVGVGLFRNPIDLNGDAIPDSCQCPADLDGDGIVGPIDLALVIGAWGSDGIGDITGDGVVSADDLGSLLGAWGPC